MEFSSLPKQGARWGTEQRTRKVPLRVGTHMTPEEEIPVENRNQVSTLVRGRVLASETGNLWPVKAAIRSPWTGWNEGVVFYGSNETPNDAYLSPFTVVPGWRVMRK